MKIVVHTAISGGYDTLKKQPKQNIDVDFVCYTDGELEKEDGANRKIVEKKLNYWHPRLNAKRFRMHPSELAPDYDIHIRMDGSGRLLSEESIRYFVDCLGSADIALFKHPERQTIGQEAIFCYNHKKYISMGRAPTLQKQIKFYQWMGFDTGGPTLPATGLLVTRSNEKMKKFFDDWRKENLYRTRQDQVSFGFAEWKNPDVSRVFIPGNLRENEYVDFKNPHEKKR